MTKIEVSSLHYYPIKSCRVSNPTKLELGERGPRFDRHWMLIDQNNVFLTQRQHSKLALINPSVQEKHLVIPETPKLSLKIPIDNTGPRIRVRIWDDTCGAIDDGDLAAEFFSDFLKVSCRLVHMPEDFVREKAPGFGRFEFADSWPLLLASLPSLIDLNSRIITNGRTPVPMDRFRPNIVVDGNLPYAEDVWSTISVGGKKIKIVKPCIRCPIPQVNQETGIKGLEPNKTLYTYRRISHKDVIFAQKAAALDFGTIIQGAEVEILEFKDPPKLT